MVMAVDFVNLDLSKSHTQFIRVNKVTMEAQGSTRKRVRFHERKPTWHPMQNPHMELPPTSTMSHMGSPMERLWHRLHRKPLWSFTEIYCTVTVIFHVTRLRAFLQHDVQNPKARHPN